MDLPRAPLSLPTDSILGCDVTFCEFAGILYNNFAIKYGLVVGRSVGRSCCPRYQYNIIAVSAANRTLSRSGFRVDTLLYIVSPCFRQKQNYSEQTETSRNQYAGICYKLNLGLVVKC